MGKEGGCLDYGCSGAGSRAHGSDRNSGMWCFGGFICSQGLCMISSLLSIQLCSCLSCNSPAVEANCFVWTVTLSISNILSTISLACLPYPLHFSPSLLLFVTVAQAFAPGRGMCNLSADSISGDHSLPSTLITFRPSSLPLYLPP